MRVNVVEQFKEDVGNVRFYSVDEVTDEGFPVRGEVKFTRTNRSILVTGKLRAYVANTCSRCLQEFEQVLGCEIEEEFFPKKDIFSGLSTPVAEDIEGFKIGEDNILDMSEAIRQNIILSMPQKPLCRQDCAGLCPKCGWNLNYGSCSCQEGFDHRWAPLRELLSKGASSKRG